MKRSNGHVAADFQPVIVGPHTISILFNRVAIPNTPIRLIVETEKTDEPTKEIENRSRSLSAEKILDPIHSRLSKSNDLILQTSSSQTATPINNETSTRPERISRSEDRTFHPTTRTMTPMNDLQIQKCHILKEKFERQQPIDTVFG